MSAASSEKDDWQRALMFVSVWSNHAQTLGAKCSDVLARVTGWDEERAHAALQECVDRGMAVPVAEAKS